MLTVLHVLAIVLVAIPMGLVMAHALEYPGKLKLGRDEYLTVQPIYSPGFTIGGLAEPAALLALVVLLFLTPPGTIAFWLTLAAFAAMALMHMAYWLLTHPVNKFWLKDANLKGASAAFFGTGAGSFETDDWRSLRDRWEMSHVLRAVLAFAAFVLLLIALAL
jgi:hypothetical protein